MGLSEKAALFSNDRDTYGFMKTPVKIVLGLGGIAPIPFFALMCGLFIYVIVRYENPGAQVLMDNAVFINLFFLVFGLIFTAVQIIYIIHAAKNPNIEAMRVTWILCLILLGPFAMPFYWYHHIWPEGRHNPASQPLELTAQERQ